MIPASAPAPEPVRFGRLLRGVLTAALALGVLLMASGCSSPPAKRGLREEVIQEPKSVLVGELIAIFPGLLWHGLGHRYAGDIKKAEEIELMEAYSLVGMGAGTGLVLAGRSDDDLQGLEISGYTVGGLGALAFIGSWIYDIIYTPSAVHRYNARLGLED